MYTKGATFLHLLIGPCAAGKSTVADKYRDIPGMVISTDELRKQITGDFMCQYSNDKVYSYLRGHVTNRIMHGLPVWVDCTNYRRRERLQITKLAPRDGDWRLDVMKPNGKNIVQDTHDRFQLALPDILDGDGLPNVIVHDARSN
jgi:hypothetical protein